MNCNVWDCNLLWLSIIIPQFGTLVTSAVRWGWGYMCYEAPFSALLLLHRSVWALSDWVFCEVRLICFCAVWSETLLISLDVFYVCILCFQKCWHFIGTTLMFLCILRLLHTFITDISWVGQGNAVGIATCYGLDGSGMNPGDGRDFPHPSRLALGSTQPPIQWVPGFSRG
jgi:hypothetical protein